MTGVSQSPDDADRQRSVETPQPNLFAGRKPVEKGSRHLHQPVQSAAQTVGSSLPRTMYVAARRWLGQPPPQERLPSRAPDSRPREAAVRGCALEEFCLEQSAGVSASAVGTLGLALRRSVAGREMAFPSQGAPAHEQLKNCCTGSVPLRAVIRGRYAAGNPSVNPRRPRKIPCARSIFLGQI